MSEGWSGPHTGVFGLSEIKEEGSTIPYDDGDTSNDFADRIPWTYVERRVPEFLADEIQDIINAILAQHGYPDD